MFDIGALRPLLADLGCDRLHRFGVAKRRTCERMLFNYWRAGMTLRNSGPLSNLAARLGHSTNSRLLIVNCDDLGSSHSAHVATFRSMVYGVATSDHNGPMSLGTCSRTLPLACT